MPGSLSSGWLEEENTQVPVLLGVIYFPQCDVMNPAGSQGIPFL
jgi:hypothetical protein